MQEPAHTQEVAESEHPGPARRFGLHGRVALVTGGAGAIGSAVCVALAEHGADVAVTDLAEGPPAEVAGRVRALGRGACSLACDARQPEQVKQAVARTVGELGRIDILIHTAGYGVLNPLAEMSLEDFEENLRAFLISAFLLSQAVGTTMIRQGTGGSIVHISSIASARALGRGTGAYAAAKAGLNALVRELAVEWGPHGIRVNAVAPCQVNTPSLARLLDSGLHGGRDALVDRMVSRIPLGRLGEPEEIARCVTFLAAEQSGFINGSTISANGAQFFV